MRMSSAMAPALPQELIEGIIDELADDHETLQACGLTARRWLHRSRYHLYGTFTLRHRNYHVHPTRRAQSEQRLSALQLGLESASESLATVLSYARVLHVRGESSNLCFHKDDEAGESEAAGEMFWLLLEKLAHVRTVRVSELYCSDVPVAKTARFCAALRGATHLSLSDCEFRGPWELGLVLGACPNLRSLKLEWIFWSHNYQGHWWGARAGNAAAITIHAGNQQQPMVQARSMCGFGLPAVRFAKLDHLQIGYCARNMGESVVGIFASAQDTMSVTRLSVGPTGLDLEMLPSWIRVVGSSLQELELSLGQIACPEVARKVSGCLKNCTSLRKLVLCAKPWDVSSVVLTNPHFWPCSLEIVRGALGLPALTTIELIWTARDADLHLGSDRTSVLRPLQDVLVCPGQKKREYGYRQTRAQTIDIVLTTRTPDGRTRQSMHHYAS